MVQWQRANLEVYEEVTNVKLAVTISDFPLLFLETMKQDLAKRAKCDITQSGSDVSVTCDADMVKCMEVIAIVDRYNFRVDDKDHDMLASASAP